MEPGKPADDARRTAGGVTRRSIKLVSRAVLASLLAGCAGTLQAPAPMRFIDYPDAARAKCLFVLLPGRGDRAETFAQRGFIEALRGRGLSIDVRASDATFGYYMRGSFVDRLSADVIAPAGEYEEIWLVGPSMGGFGGLFYARSHPGQIRGVLAIAPFLGDDELIAEIAAAGGLRNWPAPPRAATVGRDNYQPELWRWLKSATRGEEAAPSIFLGYGESDRLARANALLAEELPPRRVFRTSGGHDWAAWRRVLDRFLESPDFAGQCR